ncbi:Serine/threonine-protein kinase PLK4 [Bienertia sinuspersici]
MAILTGLIPRERDLKKVWSMFQGLRKKSTCFQTPLDDADQEVEKSGGGPSSELVNAVVQQVMKVFSEKQGGSSSRSNNSEMSCNFADLKYPVNVRLPNGNLKKVTKIGEVKLNEKITIKNVLLIPEFKNNLLSISKLVRNKKFIIEFNEGCNLQDPTSKKIVANGFEQDGIYILNATEKKEKRTRSEVSRNNVMNCGNDEGYEAGRNEYNGEEEEEENVQNQQEIEVEDNQTEPATPGEQQMEVRRSTRERRISSKVRRIRLSPTRK